MLKHGDWRRSQGREKSCQEGRIAAAFDSQVKRSPELKHRISLRPHTVCDAARELRDACPSQAIREDEYCRAARQDVKNNRCYQARLPPDTDTHRSLGSIVHAVLYAELRPVLPGRTYESRRGE